MHKDFIQGVVVIVVGKQAEPIAELLDSKKHQNEFNIAKKMDITINQTRNILYKLSDYGLVSSIRKKDKKKGWYTYFWKIEPLKVLEFLKGVLNKRIDQINKQIKSREEKQFYTCKTCNIEFNEDNALLMDFTCNECGEIFTMKDNTKLLRELKKNLDKFNKKMEAVDEEIKIEKIKIEKVRLKEEAKAKKEASEKRAAKRAENKRKKELLEKKLGIKKVPVKSKKKVVKKKKATKKVSVKGTKKVKLLSRVKKVAKKVVAPKGVPRSISKKMLTGDKKKAQKKK